MKKYLVSIIIASSIQPVAAQNNASSTYFDDVLQKSGQLACINDVRNMSQGLVLGGEQSGYASFPVNAEKNPDQNAFDIFVKTQQGETSAYANLVGIKEPSGCQLVASRVTVVPAQCSKILSSETFKGSKIESDKSGMQVVRGENGNLIGFVSGTPQSCSMVELISNGKGKPSKSLPSQPVQRCEKVEKDLKNQLVSNGMDFPISNIDTNYVKSGLVIQKVEGTPEATMYYVAANAKDGCDVAINQTMLVNQSCTAFRSNNKAFASMKAKHTNKNGGTFYGQDGNGMDFLLDDIDGKSCLISGIQFVTDLK